MLFRAAVSSRGRRLFSAFLVCLFFMSAWPALAADPLEMRTEDERTVTWTLDADKVSTLNEAEVMEATGNVALRRGDDYLKADYARYYMSTKWVYLKGNVVVHMGKDDIKAEEAEFDLRSRTGWMKKGEIFMAGPHTYFAGEQIDKHWGDVYTFKKAKITTCDGESPAWSFTADEAVVEIDGYARLWGSSFQIADVPTIYSPFLVLPAKKERQSGFLMPDMGMSEKRGFFYNQPYFWAINDYSDMTFNEYFMAERGFMQGMEYRNRMSEDEALWLRFDWLKDKQTIKDDGDNYDLGGDGLVRTNSDRYWLRGMFDARLPGDAQWRLRGDLDYVSDQYFLRDFKDSYSGYRRSRNELFSLFSRDLQEKDQDRRSGIMLFRDWERGSFALSGRYTQDPTLGNGNQPRSEDDTVQALPVADAFLHKGRILPDFPLEIAASAQAGYMYRQSGTRGARYDINPSLSIPINTRYGSIMATGAIRQTIYDTENPAHSDNSPDNSGNEYGDSRTLPAFQAAGSTEFARIYHLDSAPLALTKENAGQSRWTGLRHAVRPRVGYRNIPMVDQHNNPYYDESDRIGPQNELFYELENVITRKREQVTLRTDDKGVALPEVSSDYLDVVRLRFAQAYSIREARRDDDLDTYDRQPFSDFLTDLTLNYDQYLGLSTRSYYSPYLNKVTKHEHGIKLTWPEHGTFYTGLTILEKVDDYYRQRDNRIAQWRFAGNTILYGPWSTAFYFDLDVNSDSQAERGLDLIYNHQCFQVIFRYADDSDGDQSYRLLFSLSGLGD